MLNLIAFQTLIILHSLNFQEHLIFLQQFKIHLII